jgi:glycosyltransferase involved in cell wall biosynthesis
MSRCSIVSFRFGPTDGVSVVARNWATALHRMGFAVDWVAGGFEPGWSADGPATVVPGLEIGGDGPDPAALAAALDGADLVVVENLCTIPLNPAAAHAVADALRGRPAVLHHHDPPWQRKRFAHVVDLPPDDAAWRHVTVNDLTRRQMVDRGLAATTIHNGFDPDPPPGDRAGTRARLGIDDDTIVVAHPVRAIPRKRVDRALAVTAELGGTYWLPGPAEDGYGPELDRLLAGAPCPVRRHPADDRSDLYAACDLVVFPSTWEGFGNPPVEAALHLRPAIVGDYPVADELRALGFEWFPADDLDRVRAWLADADPALLNRNREVAARELSLDRMAGRLQALLDEAGWLP